MESFGCPFVKHSYVLVQHLLKVDAAKNRCNDRFSPSHRNALAPCLSDHRILFAAYQVCYCLALFCRQTFDPAVSFDGPL